MAKLYISAVPPLMVKTPANPLGLPKSVFDDLQAQLFANRAKFYYDLPAGPFYGFNRPGVKTIEPIVWNWWRQGMMGGAKAHYDGIVAFSQTDFTEDLKKMGKDSCVVSNIRIIGKTAKGAQNRAVIVARVFQSFRLGLQRREERAQVGDHRLNSPPSLNPARSS